MEYITRNILGSGELIPQVWSESAINFLDLQVSPDLNTFTANSDFRNL